MNDMSEPQGKAKLDTADIIKVLKYLPHRYPFLMLDRIYDMDGDQSCIGLKNVTINEPFFQGHFPQFPVMPGVLIIEGLAQTAGALCVHSLGQDYKAELVYFMAIDRAKFRKPVLPGDQIHYHVRKIRNRGRVWRFFGEAKVDGKTVAEAEVSAMLADSADARAFAAGMSSNKNG
jgi:3-hydroxyacyl-[acyl-carrier-protein] dehydratase